MDSNNNTEPRRPRLGRRSEWLAVSLGLIVVIVALDLFQSSQTTQQYTYSYHHLSSSSSSSSTLSDTNNNNNHQKNVVVVTTSTVRILDPTTTTKPLTKHGEPQNAFHNNNNKKDVPDDAPKQPKTSHPDDAAVAAAVAAAVVVLPRTPEEKAAQIQRNLEYAYGSSSSDNGDSKNNHDDDTSSSDPTTTTTTTTTALLQSQLQLQGQRSNRFPSVTERVKLYLSNWYVPPCDDAARISYLFTNSTTTTGGSADTFLTLREIATARETSSSSKKYSQQEQQRWFEINSFFFGTSVSGSFDQAHFMDRTAMKECEHRYCKDVVQFMFPSLKRLYANNAVAVPPPIIYQFGDDNRTKALRKPSRQELQLYDQQQQQQKGHGKNIKPFKRQTDRYPNIPVFKKIRRSLSASELERVTTPRQNECYDHGERRVPDQYHLEPIVFKLKTQRHYGRIADLADFDIPWHSKKNVAVFRGELNGNYPVDYVTSGRIERESIHDRCRLLDRCWVVYTHADSKTVDAKITLPFPDHNSKQIPRYMSRRREGVVVESAKRTSVEERRAKENGGDDDEKRNDGKRDDDDGDDDGVEDEGGDKENDDDDTTNEEEKDDMIDLYGNKIVLEDMLKYKALIMLEGNDVSSGLKWALFSNSVVLMPPPTVTSWAMEELLVPWVHYIPIDATNDNDDDNQNNDGMTDVERKMQWIIDHDVEAQAIARAGKLWIADLVLHPDVVAEEASIFDEMIVRYAAHFVAQDSSASGDDSP